MTDKIPLDLRPEPETPQDILAEIEGEQENLQSEADNIEDESENLGPREPSVLDHLLAEAPALITNKYWAYRKIGELSVEQRQVLHEESLRTLASYDALKLPPWLNAIIDPLKKLCEPWAGLVVVLFLFTKEQEQIAREKAAKDITPDNDSEPQNET